MIKIIKKLSLKYLVICFLMLPTVLCMFLVGLVPIFYIGKIFPNSINLHHIGFMLGTQFVIMSLFFVFGYKIISMLFFPLELISNQEYNAKQVEVDGLVQSADKDTSKIIRKFSTLRNELFIADEIKNISSQVAHDIRSPLAALNVAVHDLRQIPEDRRILIRSAIQRIEDIVNDLSSKKDKSESSSQIEDKKVLSLIPSLVEALVSEKRMQYRAYSNVAIRSDFEDGTHGLFAEIHPREFKRSISNLVNNSIEAFETGGEVVVSVSLHEDYIHISVRDNGKGIPQHVLNKLGERGASFGKEHMEKAGSGLGLHHTKESLKKWGGRLSIESELGKGTNMIMILPKAKAPDWFVESVKIVTGALVVVLDDDESIHKVWQTRFDEKKIPRERVLHFHTPESLIAWYSKEKPSGEILYLSDQEFLGCGKTGTQTIKELGIASQSILVTSRFEDDDVREACAEMKVKLLPKNLAGYVPILRSMEQENNKVVQTPDELVKNSEKQTSKRSRILSTNGEGLGASLCDQSALGGSEKQTSPGEKLESNGSGLRRRSTPRNDTNKTLALDPQSHQKSSAFLILIDDDFLVHATWKARASMANKEIFVFSDPFDFIKQQNDFSKDIPIYIDSNLKNGVKGEEVSKDIYELGFTEIYLATGDDASEFGFLSHIKSVVGKSPPF